MKTTLNTQRSSKSRVKEDMMGEETMKTLYSVFQQANINDFKRMCIEAIDSSAGKLATKATFMNMINNATNKTVMLQKVTNYFLAGEGKGV